MVLGQTISIISPYHSTACPFLALNSPYGSLLTSTRQVYFGDTEPSPVFFLCLIHKATDDNINITPNTDAKNKDINALPKFIVCNPYSLMAKFEK